MKRMFALLPAMLFAQVSSTRVDWTQVERIYLTRLTTAGPWIKDSQCQMVLLRLIRETEEEHGWPWTYIIAQLTDDWGWTPDQLEGL